MSRTRKLKALLLLTSLLFLMVACSPKPDFEVYKGKELKIAVLGTAPEVEEEQVKFQELALEDFNDEKLKEYDAVFITKEQLSQAAESEYAPVYLDSHVPFFFLESNTGAYPFIDADLAYDDAREIPYHEYYATGFLSTPQGEEKTWTYGLHNDEVKEENIKEVFSRIFKTIEENPASIAKQ